MAVVAVAPRLPGVDGAVAHGDGDEADDDVGQIRPEGRVGQARDERGDEGELGDQRLDELPRFYAVHINLRLLSIPLCANRRRQTSIVSPPRNALGSLLRVYTGIRNHNKVGYDIALFLTVYLSRRVCYRSFSKLKREPGATDKFSSLIVKADQLNIIRSTVSFYFPSPV